VPGDGHRMSPHRNGFAGHTAYERRFAALIAPEASAFAFWKGRVALYAILRALDVGPGDEVIVPGFTCVVVPNAIRLTGASPVYADIADGGYNVDPARVAAAITPRTRAVVMQHSFGLPAAADQLREIAGAHGLRIIEDCAHALGGTLGGRTLGTLGDASFFSFQWSKPYTTGLGGMAVTRDPELAARLRDHQSRCSAPPLTARAQLYAQYQAYVRLFSPKLYWRAQGILRTVSRVGLFVGSSSVAELKGELPSDHTWLMAGFQQSTGERLIGTLPARDAHARALAGRYASHLDAGGWPTPELTEESRLLRYPLMVGNKEALLDLAREKRIELGSWFETPLHPVPLEQHAVFGYAVGDCPNAERAAERIVNLPLHARVAPDEADRIARFVVRHAVHPRD
jgi:perosamine synthetase